MGPQSGGKGTFKGHGRPAGRVRGEMAVALRHLDCSVPHEGTHLKEGRSPFNVPAGECVAQGVEDDFLAPVFKPVIKAKCVHALVKEV